MKKRLHRRIWKLPGLFAKDLEDKEVILTLKVGEGGRTFGSVSTKEISEAAKKQLNLDIEKKNWYFLTRSAILV